FDTLEFRTLYERLTAQLPAQAPDAALEAMVEEVKGPLALEALARQLDRTKTVTLRVAGDRFRCREAPSALGFLTPGGASVLRLGGGDHETARRLLGPALDDTQFTTHGSKEALLRMRAMGIQPKGVVMDTEIAAYLVDPARGSYPLDELVRRYLKRELALHSGPAAEGQQSLDLTPAPDDEVLMLGTEVVALEQLAPLLEKELVERGGWNLLRDLELPLAAVLAGMEWAGVKVDVRYLEAMSSNIASELRGIEEEIFRHAGGPFNINSPPQLRTVLYERLGLRPSKRTKTGFSTDASVLESLREEHPIVDAILRFRERAKLKSTYIDALPPLVDPRTRRLHCRFNQTVAATGRLSSDSPNLQNIPVRTEEGRQIRRAFIPEDGYLLLVADYSQIELRVLAHLSGDPELVSAFERGQDIHRSSIAKALGIDEDSVTPELRSIGKMVSDGVTYGMGPYGLSQRLRIPMEAARTYIEGFFALYPGVRTYLDSVVGRAAEEGFTTTILGRRRYLPELRAANPRIRSLGERMALNAPIQGSAADIMKLAMVRADASLGEGPARMVLTVHDELVLEVPAGEIQEVGARVREAMEGAVELSVPLKVDLAWGANWAGAKGG
ncbi:MAG: DNA polymerase I, partial [Actinomycetota bacterium]